MSKRKPLTKKELEKVFEYIDNCLWRKEYIMSNGSIRKRKLAPIYSNTNDGYCQIRFNGKGIMTHCVIWILNYGEIPENLCIDHVNGNKSDNRLENLRLVTLRQNGQNRREHRQGNLYGCSYHKHHKKWQARAWVGKKRIHIGYFNTEEEAHKAYLDFTYQKRLA